MFDPWLIIGKIVEALGLAPKGLKDRYKKDCEKCMRYLVTIRQLHGEIEEGYQESRIINLKLGSNTLKKYEYQTLYDRQETIEHLLTVKQREMDNLQADLDYIVSKYT